MPLQVTQGGKKTCLKITAFLIQCVTTGTTPSKLKWNNGTLNESTKKQKI